MRSIVLCLSMAVAMLLATSTTALAGRLDPHLTWIADHGAHARGAASRLAPLKKRDGTVYASVILEAKPAAIARLTALGARVHSVLPTGIVTADVPVDRLAAVAATRGVGRIEAGRLMHTVNDNSNGLASYGGDVQGGMNNPGTYDGTGVCVGVIDSGLDWTHGDFIEDATGLSRIAYYWDQSDHADTTPPSGFSYGTE